MNFYAYIEQELDRIEQRQQLRNLNLIHSRHQQWINFKQRKYFNLSSNDYLGLAADQNLREEFFSQEKDEHWYDWLGSGSSSSCLLTGYYKIQHQLEQELEKWYQNSVLLLNSGFHANTGIIPALAGKHDLIISDKLNHASMIDGIKLSGSTYYRFTHKNYQQLEELLIKYRSDYQHAFILSESLFSMDGDRADLRQLAELKKKYDCLLYLDEAHALGVWGSNGLGVAEEQGVLSDVDLLVATFGKALASQGAFVVCQPVLKQYLINRCRSLIYTTALPPYSLSWTYFLLKKRTLLKKKQHQLHLLCDWVHDQLEQIGIVTADRSQIIPIILGNNQLAVRKADLLKQNAYYVLPIRAPTVPENKSRLRISLCANMNEQDFEDFFKLLAIDKNKKEGNTI